MSHCLVIKVLCFLAATHLYYHKPFCLSRTFFKFFKFFQLAKPERRRRDLNPRAAINDLLPFQGSPFGQLGYFSKLPFSYHIDFRLFNMKRRGWDSNPRALADKRFSRPPRYDHFDISPYAILRFPIFFSLTRITFYHQTSFLSRHKIKYFSKKFQLLCISH